MTTTLAPSELVELSATETAAAVARGDVSPVDLADALLAQIERLDSKMQAWSAIDPADVRAQAKALAEEAAAGNLRGPLHGVPIAAKEQFAVKGFGTRENAALPAGPPSPDDSTAVERLRAAGAIVMGKLYMVGSLGMPPTRNPWNLEHTPGGSSSGSGAAVAARMVPIALGEQTAGSNIRPASFCGVAALKPTYGVIPRYGMFAMAWSHDHAAMIARTVADLALSLSVMAGYDPRDPTSRSGAPPLATLDMESLAPPRIGLVTTSFPERTTPEMQAAVEAAAKRFAAAGAEIVKLPLPPEFELTWQAHTIVGGAEGVTINARKDAAKAASPDAAFRAMPMRHRREVSSLIPATYYLQSQRIRRWLHESFKGLFTNVDMLLTGAAPGEAPRDLTQGGDPVLQVPSSFLGYPSTTVNAGLSANGLPLGVQFMGAPLTDYRLLQHTAWCESVLGRLPAPAMDWAT